MSDERERPKQEQTKKPWITPVLTMYGTVEELTQGNQGNKSTDNTSGVAAPAKRAPATPTRKP